VRRTDPSEGALSDESVDRLWLVEGAYPWTASGTVYKWLNGHWDERGFYYHLGQWKPALSGDLEPCRNAYSGYGVDHLAESISLDLYVIESQSEWIEGRYKLYSRGPVRIIEHLRGWDERTARLFACDCAERALLREREAGREPDERAWQAVRVARRRTLGTPSARLIVTYDDYERINAAAASYRAADVAACAAYGDAFVAAGSAAIACRAAAQSVSAAAAAAEARWQGERILDYAYGRINASPGRDRDGR
jgi:hypothetical protein